MTRCINGYRRIYCRQPCDGLASHPGGSRNTIVASHYENEDKPRPDGLKCGLDPLRKMCLRIEIMIHLLCYSGKISEVCVSVVCYSFFACYVLYSVYFSQYLLCHCYLFWSNLSSKQSLRSKQRLKHPKVSSSCVRRLYIISISTYHVFLLKKPGQ